MTKAKVLRSLSGLQKLPKRATTFVAKEFMGCVIRKRASPAVDTSAMSIERNVNESGFQFRFSSLPNIFRSFRKAAFLNLPHTSLVRKRLTDFVKRFLRAPGHSRPNGPRRMWLSWLKFRDQVM